MYKEYQGFLFTSTVWGALNQEIFGMILKLFSKFIDIRAAPSNFCVSHTTSLTSCFEDPSLFYSPVLYSPVEKQNTACSLTNSKICFYCFSYRNSLALLGRERRKIVLHSKEKLLQTGFFVEIVSRNKPKCFSPKTRLYNPFCPGSTRGHCDLAHVPAGIPLRDAQGREKYSESWAEFLSESSPAAPRGADVCEASPNSE